MRTGEHSVKTMLLGLDQYPEEDVMVIKTADGAYVVGPEVSAGEKTRIHTVLTQAVDRLITIRYVKKPATRQTIAHKRVSGLIIEEKTYHLPH